MIVASAVIPILFWIVGIFVLYIVISTAVKNGINKSDVGQFIERKYGVKEDEKSFLDSDLDNDKLNAY